MKILDSDIWGTPENTSRCLERKTEDCPMWITTVLGIYTYLLILKGIQYGGHHESQFTDEKTEH